MPAKEKRGAGIIGFAIIAGIVLYLALELYPGPFPPHPPPHRPSVL